MRFLLRPWCWIVGHRFTRLFVSKICRWDAVNGVTEDSCVSGKLCARCGLERLDEAVK